MLYMRIVLYVTLLLASLNSFAQGVDAESRSSSNVEPHRSYMLPSSSAQEAASDKSAAMRYAIPVEGWQEHYVGQGSVFSSSFETPFSWIGRQTIISIESASAPYSVEVDGRTVGRCENPSIAAQFNITNYIESEVDTPIEITLNRDASTSSIEGWRTDDRLTLGRVVMLSQPTMYIRDVTVETTRLSGVLNASVAIVVKSEALNDRTSRINYELLTPQGAYVTRGDAEMTLSMRQEDTIRLFAIIPDSLAWSAENPNLYELNLSTQHRGRHQEYYSFKIGLRSLEQHDRGELLVNGVPQPLKAVEISGWAEIEELIKIKQSGYNAVKIAAGEHNEKLYSYADSLGLYLVATAPINSSQSANTITRGGNPTNDPTRGEEYIERVDAIYNSTKLHPSVIAYAIADSSLNGINLYESYLYLKQREKHRPIIYLDSQGEWNSDRLKMEL